MSTGHKKGIWMLLLRAGHSRAGTVHPEALAQMHRDSATRPLTCYDQDGHALGDCTETELRNGGTELWAKLPTKCEI